MLVGTRELKNRLSHYLRQVRAGQVVHVTDHGKVVAELRPAAPSTERDGAVLMALEAEGIVSQGLRKPGTFVPVRVKSRHRASDIVIEERR